jgi:hypothetical protein
MASPCIDVDGQAAAQVGKGEVAGQLPAPVAKKFQKQPETCTLRVTRIK